MRARVAALLAVVLLSLGLVAGCGGGRWRRPQRRSSTRRAAASRSANGSDFDAQAVYDRAAPGVVTVLSVFDNGGGDNLEEELEPEGGELPPDERRRRGRARAS